MDDLLEELKRFNEYREAMLQGKPIDPDNRMPIPRTYVGGDLPIPGEDE